MADPARAAANRASHETDAFDGRRLVWVALALVALLAACIGASIGITRGLASHYARPAAWPPSRLPTTAGPPLEADPAATLARFRAEKAAGIEGYRWVDRAHGIASVPIDVAMRIVAARHAPGAAAPAQGPGDALPAQGRAR